MNIAYTLITEDWDAERRAVFDEQLASVEEQREIADRRQDAQARRTAAMFGHSVDQMVASAAQRRAYWLARDAEEKGKAG